MDGNSHPKAPAAPPQGTPLHETRERPSATVARAVADRNACERERRAEARLLALERDRAEEYRTLYLALLVDRDYYREQYRALQGRQTGFEDLLKAQKQLAGLEGKLTEALRCVTEARTEADTARRRILDLEEQLEQLRQKARSTRRQGPEDHFDTVEAIGRPIPAPSVEDIERETDGLDGARTQTRPAR